MKAYPTQTEYFKVLMHPTRLAILDVLRDGEECVCHMEALFGLRQAHISQHLMVLRDAGLVADRRDGWNVFYRVIKPEIYQVIDAMNAFCGVTIADIQASTASMADQKACPCPKCNAGVQTNRPAMIDMGRDQVETTI